MSKVFGSRMVLLVPFTCASAIFVWAMVLPVIVKARAASIAGAHPSCIQVRGDKFDYRPVTSWLDLTAFAMRVPFEGAGGSDDAQWTFHAVLVVEGDLYNWSHMKMNFLAVSSNVAEALHLRPRCVPAHH